MSQNAHGNSGEQPHVPLPPMEQPVEYTLLTGHQRTDGSMKSSDQLHTEYITLTDRLIHKMTDGVEVRSPETGEMEVRKPDYVIWLDKSARPVAWLAKELWPRLAPEPGETEVPKMPEFCFVNIDREQWVTSVDPNGTGYMDIDRIDDTIIRSLRSIFVEPKNKKDGLTEAIDDEPAALDGKTIMIVDEVLSSGRTLEIASKFFERAFPTAAIAGEHWMGGVTAGANGLGVGNADIPVWYKKNDPTGRGVAGREDNVSAKSNSVTQRLGSYFLSTRFPEMDPDSVKLRQEIRKLAHDPDVLIVPDSKSRTLDSYDERAISLNGVANFNEFVEKVAELNHQTDGRHLRAQK